VIVGDTETTGLNEKDGYIAQLTYLKVDDSSLKILKAQNSFFKIPFGSMEPDAMKIHGLSEDLLNELSEGRRFGNCYEEILKDFENEVIVCHNVNFDLKFLKEEFRRCGVKENKFKPKTFCTMEHFTNIIKLPPKEGRTGYKWPRLEETMNFLKISPEEVIEKTKEVFGSVKEGGFHDARFDTIGLYCICCEGVKNGWI